MSIETCDVQWRQTGCIIYGNRCSIVDKQLTDANITTATSTATTQTSTDPIITIHDNPISVYYY